MSLKEKKIAQKHDHAGQPTKYKPEYCQQLIAWMKKPRSYESFASTIGVDRDSLYEWEKKHKEFSDAKKKARMACQASCEALLIAQSTGQIKGGSTASLIFFMKNVTNFRDDPVQEDIGYDDMEFME